MIAPSATAQSDVHGRSVARNASGNLRLAAVACLLLVACNAPRVPLSAPTGAIPLEDRPLIIVSADVERRVAADSARVVLAVELVGATPQEAIREVSKRAKLTMQALSEFAHVKVSIGEVSVTEAHTFRPEGISRDSWSPEVSGHYARVEVSVSGASPGGVAAIVRSGLLAGANAAEVELWRDDCTEVMEEMRVEAVRHAHLRAVAVATEAQATVGGLVKLKEEESSCAGVTRNAIKVRARPASDGSQNPGPTTLPELHPLLINERQLARLSVVLVYELQAGRAAPLGQSAGEVHLALVRPGSSGSDVVAATVGLRVRSLEATASDALEKSARAMTVIIEALTAAGLHEDEVVGGRLRMAARTKLRPTGPGMVRTVRDYIAESSIEIETKRLDELGRWIALAGEVGATGLEGPKYTLLEPDPLVDAALVEGVTAALKDAGILSSAAAQSIRAVTQIRMDDLRLSEEDPLHRFLEGFGSYGRSGWGSGAGSIGDGELEPHLDTGIPAIEIRPPVVSTSHTVSVGFALLAEHD